MKLPTSQPDLDRDDPELKFLDPVGFNFQAERRFLILVGNLCSSGPQPVNTILQEAAFELNVSTETARRYLVKHTASRATLEIDDGMVSVKPPPKKRKK